MMISKLEMNQHVIIRAVKMLLTDTNLACDARISPKHFVIISVGSVKSRKKSVQGVSIRSASCISQ